MVRFSSSVEKVGHVEQTNVSGGKRSNREYVHRHPKLTIREIDRINDLCIQ